MLPREPTSDECTANATVLEDERRLGFACWYPQMGGYVGKCVVLVEKNADRDRCFSAYVWHDGSFPFGDNREPVRLHHCDSDQFRHFADLVDTKICAQVDGFDDVIKAFNFLEDGTIVTGAQGEAWDVIKRAILKDHRQSIHGWRADEIGALMIAAPQAIDTVERLSNRDDFYDYAGLTERLAMWRKAVSREP